MIVAMLLAASAPEGAGGLALLVVSSLAVATALLYRSMKKQLRKVPKSFDAPAEPPAED